MVDSYVFIII
jgi:hypothetical protein